MCIRKLSFWCQYQKIRPLAYSVGFRGMPTLQATWNSKSGSCTSRISNVCACLFIIYSICIVMTGGLFMACSIRTESHPNFKHQLSTVWMFVVLLLSYFTKPFALLASKRKAFKISSKHAIFLRTLLKTGNNNALFFNKLHTLLQFCDNIKYVAYHFRTHDLC